MSKLHKMFRYLLHMSLNWGQHNQKTEEDSLGEFNGTTELDEFSSAARYFRRQYSKPPSWSKMLGKSSDGSAGAWASRC